MKIIPFLICLILPFTKCIAWGPEGHAIVGRLAMQFVEPDVRDNIKKVLGTMSIDTAANWMDIMRSNSDYDFMKPWHYIELLKDKKYEPSDKPNIINRLIQTYNQLQNKKLLCEEQVRFDVLIMLHLIGDLHMPLHTSYGEDLGGNKV